MEQLHVSKNPTLEIISETEPHSYNVQGTNYYSHNPTQVHVQLPDSRIYKQSPNRLQQSIDGQVNQGYAGNSQSSINRDGSTPSVGRYVTYKSRPKKFFSTKKIVCQTFRVYREQYWICSQPLRCRNWTKRERILFFVLIGLSTIVLGLVAVISFISRNSNDNTESPPSWFPWL